MHFAAILNPLTLEEHKISLVALVWFPPHAFVKYLLWNKLRSLFSWQNTKRFHCTKYLHENSYNTYKQATQSNYMAMLSDSRYPQSQTPHQNQKHKCNIGSQVISAGSIFSLRCTAWKHESNRVWTHQIELKTPKIFTMWGKMECMNKWISIQVNA